MRIPHWLKIHTIDFISMPVKMSIGDELSSKFAQKLNTHIINIYKGILNEC